MARQRDKGVVHIGRAGTRALALVPETGLLADLLTAASARRCRPIRLMPVDLGPDEPSGLWVATEHADWIVLPELAGPAQQEAVICHELAHILLGHQPPGTGDELAVLAHQVAPDIDAEVARRIMSRYGYADDVEAEAEAMGTLLVTRLADRAERHRVVDDSVSDRLR